MLVRDSLEDKSMLLVHFKHSLSLYLGTPFREELTDYCFTLKVTRVFPYSYTGKKVDQRMVNTLLMIKINPTCKRFLFVRKKTETWLVSPISK